MKIQCNVCETAEATVLCCADEAALCKSCDEKIHAANKLASKHQRVALSSSNNHLPKCDICQETDGYFFCLEDRALLCRKCDVAIHTLNSLVSSHQRFLLTGVKIGLETDDDVVTSSSPVNTVSSDNGLQVPDSVCLPNSIPNSIQAVDVVGDFVPPNKLPFGGGSSAEQWQFDEFFGLADLNQNYDYMDFNNSSKTDSNKVGDSNCLSILRALEVELDADDCLGQVPDSSWAVPDISSPPTASGLNWSKGRGHHNNNNHNYHHQIDTAAAFVPDVCYSPLSSSNQSQQTLKRRRHF